MKTPLLRSLLLLLFTASVAGIHAQSADTLFHEFLVQVDIVTGAVTPIDSLPGVRLIQVGPSAYTVDEEHNWYFFVGVDATQGGFLYTIDATTGQTIYRVYPWLSPNDSYRNLAYDDSTHKLYAQYNSRTLMKAFFATIDPATGAVTFLDSMRLGSSNLYAYDQVHHRYTLCTSTDSMATFDALTGHIISVAPFPSSAFASIQYDNSSGRLYGTTHHGLYRIDPATGDTSAHIYRGPTTQNFFLALGEFNDSLQFYSFLTYDTNIIHLTSIDTGGHVLFNPRFVYGMGSINPNTQNVIQTKYNRFNHSYYALSWRRNAGPCRDTTTLLQQTICQGDSFLFYGRTLTQAGTYTNTLHRASGCDSMFSLTLSVTAPVTAYVQVAICQGDTFMLGHRALTAPGTYSDTTAGSTTCDSITVLTLSEAAPPADLAWTPVSLVVPCHGALSLGTTSPPGGRFSGPFVYGDSIIAPGIDTTFYVIYTYTDRHGCSFRIGRAFHASACTGVAEAGSLPRTQLYPNPNTGSFFADLSPLLPADGSLHYTVTDILGRQVLDQLVTSHSLYINMDEAADGLYIFQVTGAAPIRFEIRR